VAPLNLVNAGSVSRLSVSQDGYSMFVYAADGLFVRLQEVKVRTKDQLAIKAPTKVGTAHISRSTLFGNDQIGSTG
jgi:hypothetical protein